MLRPLLVLALLACGCAPPSSPDADAPASAAPAPRPATMDRSTFVEGQPETEVLRLAEVAAYPAPFSVYLRPGVAYVPPAEGEPVRFVAGEPPFQGEVTVRAAPGEPPAAVAARERDAVATSFPIDDAPWAAESFAFVDADESGTVHVAQHDGMVFVVSARAPSEMGDGFAPTLATLLDTWRWADGSALR